MKHLTREASADELTAIANLVKAEIGAADLAWRDALGHAIRAGGLLIDAKNELQRGGWLPWLREHGIPERTAQRYMRLARNASRVSDCGTLNEALAALSRKFIDLTTATEAVVDQAVAGTSSRGWGYVARGAVYGGPPEPHPRGLHASWEPWVHHCPRCAYNLYAGRTHPVGGDS